MVAVAAVVVFVALVMAMAGRARAARQHASGAADMSALGAAHARQTGTRRPCAVAAAIARANAARLSGCTIRGVNVDVTVTVAAGSVLSVPLRAAGHARAGPASSDAKQGDAPTRVPSAAARRPTRDRRAVPGVASTGA